MFLLDTVFGQEVFSLQFLKEKPTVSYVTGSISGSYSYTSNKITVEVMKVLDGKLPEIYITYSCNVEK